MDDDGIIQRSSFLSIMSIDFAEKEKEIKKVFRSPEVKKYALKTLEKIEEVYQEIKSKWELYSKGNLEYKDSILSDINFIYNNLTQKANFPKILDVSDLKALSAFFSPIRRDCAGLKQHIEQNESTEEKNNFSPKPQVYQELTRLLIEEQEDLDKLFFFKSFLGVLKKRISDKNPQPASIYFAYAWPAEEEMAKEHWVQNFLLFLKKHFELAGLSTIRLDIVSNRYGGNIYEYMEQAETNEYVILFGTESLRKKHSQGLAAVCTEIIHILRKREKDNKKGIMRVFPVLLNGSARESFPVEYERYITIRDWREKGYLANFKELYLELFTLSPEHYLSEVQKIWDEKLASLPKVESSSIKNMLNSYEKKRLEINNQFFLDRIDLPNTSSSIVITDSPKIVLPQECVLSKGKKISKFKKLFLSILLLFSFYFFFFQKDILIQKSPNINKTEGGLRGVHSDFIGRKFYLAKIKQAFQSRREEKETSVVVLWGEGGVGKSELSIAFANMHRRNYSLIYWIEAGQEVTYDRSYRNLASQLNISCKEKDPLELVRNKVHQYLEETSFSRPWLLIFDNLEEVTDLPNRGYGDVLISSRSKEFWSSFHCLQVLPFTEEEGLELFGKIIGTEESSYRKEILQELDYFPLALNQAAHYISANVSISEEEYLKLLRQNKAFVLEHMPSDKRYPFTLAASWEVTLADLHKKHPDALNWLFFCSYLGPDPIPQSWLDNWLEFFNKEKSRDTFLSNLQVNKIINILNDYSLLHYNKKAKEISFHRLRLEVVRNSKGIKRNLIQDVLTFMMAQVSGLERVSEMERHNEKWGKMQKWVPHACWILDQFIQLNHRNDEFVMIANILGNWSYVKGMYDVAERFYKRGLDMNLSVKDENKQHKMLLGDNLAWTLMSQGRNREAEELLRSNLGECRKLYGEKDPQFYFATNSLVIILTRVGKYKEAVKLAETNLELSKNLYGEGTPYSTDSVHNLAEAVEGLGQYERAEKLFKQAFSCYQILYDKKHPYVAITTHNLSKILGKLGKYKEQERELDQTVSLYKTLYGSEHIYVMRAVGELGVCLINQGKYQKAIELLRNVLKTVQQKASTDYFVVSDALDNLAFGLEKTGSFKEAKKLHEKALKLRKQILGEEHFFIVESLHHLQFALRNLGEYRQEAVVCKNALAIAEKIHGEEHPQVANSWHYLGIAYRELGKYREAKECIEKALTMKRNLLGKEHPYTADSIHHLAWVLAKQGKYKEAEAFHKEAVEIRKKILGVEHRDVATSICHLGWIYRKEGRYAEAKILQKKACRMRKKLLGKLHFDVADSYHRLGIISREQGKYREAKRLHAKALSVLKVSIQNEEHPHVADSLCHIAQVLEKQGEYRKAKHLYKQALCIRKKVLGEEHPKIADSLHCLARISSQQGKYDKAFQQYQKVLQMRKKLLGEEHPDIASTIQDVAFTLGQQEKYEEAQRLFQQAIDYRKKLLGEGHPRVADSLYRLAKLYEKRKNYKEAEDLYKKSLDLRRNCLGERHPETIESRTSWFRLLSMKVQNDRAMTVLDSL